MFPPQEDMFPPKIIWQNNGTYTGIALFLITLQVSLNLKVHEVLQLLLLLGC